MPSKDVGKLDITEIEELEDGGAIIHMEIDDVFQAQFIRTHNLDDWSDLRFQAWVIETLTKGIGQCDD